MRIGMSFAVLGAAFIVTSNALAVEERVSVRVGVGERRGEGAVAEGRRGEAPTGRQRYGAAGCGLGSLLIHNGGFVQIFAATTNGTFATQTFGITSGTSNCDDVGGWAEGSRVFVQANRVALTKDISRGKGETITDLSAMAGCADPAAVGLKLQQSFKTIFPSAGVSSDDVSDSIMATLKSDPSLACTAISG